MDLLKGAHRVERSDFVVDRQRAFLADLNDPLQLARTFPQMLRPHGNEDAMQIEDLFDFRQRRAQLLIALDEGLSDRLGSAL